MRLQMSKGSLTGKAAMPLAALPLPWRPRLCLPPAPWQQGYQVAKQSYCPIPFAHSLLSARVCQAVS